MNVLLDNLDLYWSAFVGTVELFLVSAIGSIVGGLVMAVLNNGLQLMGIGSDRVQIIKGLVLLAAVALDVYNKNQGKPSITGYLTRTFRKEPERPPEGLAPTSGTPDTARPTSVSTG